MSPSSGAFRPTAGRPTASDEVRVACDCGQLARRGLRLGPAAAARLRSIGSKPNGRAGTIRSALAACGDFTNCCRSPRRKWRSPSAKGKRCCNTPTAWANMSALERGRLFLQYEGMNPSGSFKDNGMSAAFTHARMVGAQRAACASTGNTSASLALYCAVTRLMKAHHLHRLGQDLLRQAVAGAWTTAR